jgi:anti-sigma factor RsiW
VRHGKARRLVPAILDQSLPPSVEAAVRAHLEDCPPCRTDLAELEASEELLRRLPLALVPREASAPADLRLAALARWATAPVSSRHERLGLQALGAFAAAFLLLLVVSAGRWQPVVEERNGASPISFASLPRAGITPYSWH